MRLGHYLPRPLSKLERIDRLGHVAVSGSDGEQEDRLGVSA